MTEKTKRFIANLPVALAGLTTVELFELARGLRVELRERSMAAEVPALALETALLVLVRADQAAAASLGVELPPR